MHKVLLKLKIKHPNLKIKYFTSTICNGTVLKGQRFLERTLYSTVYSMEGNFVRSVVWRERFVKGTFRVFINVMQDPANIFVIIKLRNVDKSLCYNTHFVNHSQLDAIKANYCKLNVPRRLL